MSPNRPKWKSRNAWAISALLFITNGPPSTTGWPIGSPLYVMTMLGRSPSPVAIVITEATAPGTGSDQAI
jgi:hypothetical protein